MFETVAEYTPEHWIWNHSQDTRLKTYGSFVVDVVAVPTVNGIHIEKQHNRETLFYFALFYFI